ncbi:MAG: HigA family addiction module antidote protein [Deltaproteobacteria bacterium]|nr:HigA family addiction module antidote protein [Deltaproteobacteria bacterium]
MAGKKLRNIHPGEVLEEEFIKALGITPYRLAKDIGVPQTRISEICRGRRTITADTALRLARYFGTTARFWLGLQQDYDLEEQLKKHGKKIEAICPLKATG